MELSKCIRCDKLYSKVRFPVCPQCEAAEEKEIFEVQRFLRDNPDSSLMEVSDQLDIFLDDIERWIEESRLTVAINSRAAIGCAICGASIVSGRVCAACRERLGVKTAGTHVGGPESPKARTEGTSSALRREAASSSIQKYRRS